MWNRKISEIVSNDIRTVSIFSKYGIDYCCRANKTLNSVCHEKNINRTLLIDEIKMLDNFPKPVNYNKMEVDDLINHIILEHHDYTREKNITIKSLLKKVISRHGDIFPEICEITILFNQIQLELEEHLIKEENILFPRIMELVKIKKNQKMMSGPIFSIANITSIMEREHLAAGNIFEKIKSTTKNYSHPEGSCNSIKFLYYELKELEENLHIHVHLENNILFPKAIQIEKYILEYSE